MNAIQKSSKPTIKSTSRRKHTPSPEDLWLLQRLCQVGGWRGGWRLLGAGLSQRGEKHGGEVGGVGCLGWEEEVGYWKGAVCGRSCMNLIEFVLFFLFELVWFGWLAIFWSGFVWLSFWYADVVGWRLVCRYLLTRVWQLNLQTDLVQYVLGVPLPSDSFRWLGLSYWQKEPLL